MTMVKQFLTLILCILSLIFIIFNVNIIIIVILNLLFYLSLIFYLEYKNNECTTGGAGYIGSTCPNYLGTEDIML